MKNINFLSLLALLVSSLFFSCNKDFLTEESLIEKREILRIDSILKKIIEYRIDTLRETKTIQVEVPGPIQWKTKVEKDTVLIKVPYPVPGKDSIVYKDSIQIQEKLVPYPVPGPVQWKDSIVTEIRYVEVPVEVIRYIRDTIYLDKPTPTPPPVVESEWESAYLTTIINKGNQPSVAIVVRNKSGNVATFVNGVFYKSFEASRLDANVNYRSLAHDGQGGWAPADYVKSPVGWSWIGNCDGKQYLGSISGPLSAISSFPTPDRGEVKVVTVGAYSYIILASTGEILVKLP